MTNHRTQGGGRSSSEVKFHRQWLCLYNRGELEDSLAATGIIVFGGLNSLVIRGRYVLIPSYD